MHLTINGQTHPVPEGWEHEPLLWLLREAAGLAGTRFGCGAGLCGACTVLVDGEAARACLLTAQALQGRAITTIEGLTAADGTLHPVQQAWMEHKVPQCGYCQSGQIMGAVALLRATPRPDDAQIDAAMAGHLCRCGTQRRIRAAIHHAAAGSGPSPTAKAAP
ncbi:MAG: (2Fe-2S)-binding protein [Acidovorax sp.]